MFEKFKHVLGEDHLFYGILIVLVSVGSFGLGRLSVAPVSLKTTQNAAIVLSTGDTHASAATTTALQKQGIERAVRTYVASKKGSKYHLTWCPGASQIKEENKIYFASKAEAEKSGYTPASNCKGI